MNTKQQLQKRISHIELQIKQLTQCSSNTDISESLQNTLILQKAILKKELSDLGKNPLLEKVKKILPHKKKLICDYFN